MKKNFTISPRILSHLGEDLIKNESIALLELIKNSYDACATSCIIDFETDMEGKLKKIIISDNGIGMNAQIIEDVWLKIGTDYKHKKIEKNTCGRVPLGEKGIGRLSVHKLGNVITLISRKKDEKEVSVRINWKKLNQAKKIEDFEILFEEMEKPEIFSEKSHGTKIIIEDLKTEWKKIQIREIYRNVISLNSPFSGMSDSFIVEMKSNSDLFEGLPDYQEIREAALYFCHCKMQKNKIIEFSYEFKPWSKLKEINGREVKTKNLSDTALTIVDDNREEIDLDKYEVGPIEFELDIFETDNQLFGYAEAEKTTTRNYLRENGGIRVYRDGIRVYDYGERTSDWLGIDLKRVQRVGNNVSNNIIIGAVKLDRYQSQGLTEKTNREGFIENDSYSVFTTAVDYALGLFVKERNIDKSTLTTLYKKHKIVEPVLSDLSDAIEIVNTKVQKKETRDELLKYLNRIGEQYKNVKTVLLKSANAGLNLSIVIHEIDKLMKQLTGCIERNESQDAIDLSLRLEKIVKGYSAMIKKTSIKQTKLSSIVETALENYEFRFLDHDIKVYSNMENNELKAFLSPAESISVLINLLDNSIYWLSYTRKEKKKISIYITDQIPNYHSIMVSDNGPGFNIPPSIAIEPFITGKPHNIGSGLGLHVANELMHAMKGELHFLDQKDIVFPKNVQDEGINKAIVALCFPIKE